MKKGLKDMQEAEATHGTGLIADPVYHYIVMTDRIEGEGTERDVIDTPWVQRLRRIFQLQSARWVFPTAEHTFRNLFLTFFIILIVCISG
jgi:hypothetical protein